MIHLYSAPEFRIWQGERPEMEKYRVQELTKKLKDAEARIEASESDRVKELTTKLQDAEARIEAEKNGYTSF